VIREFFRWSLSVFRKSKAFVAAQSTTPDIASKGCPYLKESIYQLT